MTGAFFATIQHTIYNGQGKAMHTIRHLADERCNYCVVLDESGAPKVLKVLIEQRRHE